jgi:Utp25, U3 small nucleolar RNA-associated SSU processome protein 25
MHSQGSRHGGDAVARILQPASRCAASNSCPNRHPGSSVRCGAGDCAEAPPRWPHVSGAPLTCRPKFDPALRGVQVKIFSEIYQSDILVASPLALATLLAEQRDDGADFLSSLEIAALFRGDVMHMQNWAHVETVFANLNQLPKQQHDTDVMRVRCGAVLFAYLVVVISDACCFGLPLLSVGPGPGHVICILCISWTTHALMVLI